MTEKLEKKAKEYADNEVPFDTTESGEKLYTKYDVEQAYVAATKELREKIMNEKCSGCKYNTVGQDEYILSLEDQNREHEEIIKRLINACCSYGATGKATADAEAFLKEIEK